MILGSSSKQRKKIMSMLFDDFDVYVSTCDEVFDDKKSVYENVKQIALDKCYSIIQNENIKNDTIVCCDTVCYLDGKVLLKPKSYDEAFTMIKSYNDKEQEVISGVCVLTIKDGVVVNTYSDTIVSRISFYNLTDEKIHTWLETGFYIHSAGGLMIEKLSGLFDMEIDGSYSNIIGLPLEDLQRYFETTDINYNKVDGDNIHLIKKYLE